MIKKVCAISLLLTLIFGFSYSQESKEERKFGIKFSGFINLQVFYDTRAMVEAREGMFTFYPAAPVFDKNGNDINDKTSLQMLAMTSRLKLDITGPDAFGAKTAAVLEGDFTGVSNDDNNGFRLRLAYFTMDWGNRNLVIGHDWHPLDVPQERVGTIALNTGAPFHSFSRFNQIRYTEKIGNLSLIAFAGMQRDYTHVGPLGRTNIYQRNAGIPNFHGQVHYQIKKHLFGAGYDWEVIKPMEVNYNGEKTDQKLSSMAAMAFAKFVFDKYEFKLQGVWGQNLTDHLMIGGYALHDTLDANGDVVYTNTNQISAWTVFEKTKGAFRPGIFMGYMKNLGADDEINGPNFSRGADIAYLYRFGPRLVYWSGKTMMAAEMEYNVIAYGTPDKMGIVKNAKEYTGIRFLIGAFYFF
jgi:hypothetical protein